MLPATRDALVERLSAYGTLVEVGIGRRTDVAAALSRRARVVATDVRERPVPDGVAFVRDDVTEPRTDVYADADAVYSLNCPPELHRPLRTVARDHGAACLFTTLGGDAPAIDALPETLPGETLYAASDGPGRGGRMIGGERGRRGGDSREP